MKTLLESVVMFAIVAGCSVAAEKSTAQELTSEAYLDYMSPFLGSWKTRLTRAGETTEGQWTISVSPTTPCFMTRFIGKDGSAAQSIDGYDPVTKKWTVIEFNSTGEYSLLRYDFLRNKKDARYGKGVVATQEIEIHTRDGRTDLGEATMTCVDSDNNRIAAQFKGAKADGQTAEVVDFAMERLPGEGQGSALASADAAQTLDGTPAADYIEFVKPFEGSWKTTMESSGEITPGTWTGRLSPARTCYVTHGENAGRPTFQSIDGYDPVSKRWAIAAFYAGGGFSLATIDFAGEKKGRHFGKGTTSTAEDRVFNNDGTTTLTTWKAECLECTADRIVYVVTDRIENGRKTPDRKFTMERIH